MARVRSVDQMDLIKMNNFQSILEVHIKENENLKQQNKFLLNEIRKKKNNELVLSNYIEQLRK